MPQRDVVTWNSIISAYALNGFDSDAVEKLSEMIGCGFKPDQVTVISILTFCSAIDIVVREVHGFVLRNGIESAPMIQNALISAYGKCGLTEDAQRIFNGLVWKDKVTWNALIASYAQNGLFEESLQLLRDMKVCSFDLDVVTYSGIISSLTQNNMSNEAMVVFNELLNDGLKPDVVAIASVLPSISQIFCLDYCKETHGYSFRNSLETDRRVRNALVSVYSKCGSVQYAKEVFEKIKDRDVISWSSMVVGYSQNQYFGESLETLRQMILDEIEPNPVTVTSALSACAGVSTLRLGKELHLWATKNSFEGQAFVGSALIDMYAKCGRIRNSRAVFDLMDDRNLVSWNSMIAGYAIHGLAHNALKIFEMVTEPDDVTFIAALSACSHGGLVEEGIAIFDRMKEFKLAPRESHYACMIDLLARSGRVEEALEMVRTMPEKASVEIWGVLLGACMVHSNFEIGVYTGEQIIDSGSANSGYYVLFSNVLANFGRWGDVEEMRRNMKEKGVRKGSGCSWIQVNKRVHSFVAKGRTQHDEWESLFSVLKFLSEQMKGMYC
ncbi:pentatricopeptide repeat-containing protein At5g16860-like isoform X2 [Phalaenopsis equestris]|nr:pentatricopeptide repeat-containing protein At5g16860-like isoform X2 [Phalaenopsis equestris]XP_020597770.1 pentatricopeptide repeat-containing protein At5g16860-like isoform X2 [Phalaenopsis equestris]